MVNLKELKQLTTNYSVLYIEDDESIGKNFSQYLKKLFNKVTYRRNGQEGLLAFKESSYDLIITDIEMPLMNGLELSKKIKELSENTNIIITSAHTHSDKILESIKIGVDGYLLKPIDYNDLNSLLFKTIKKIKTFEEHKLYEQEMQLLLEKKANENALLHLEKITNYEQTLFALIDIIESRDTYTGKHSLRVAQYCELIAKEMGYANDESNEIYKAAILHDIGKIAIPDSILLKPSSLNTQEYDLVKKHVDIGYHMLSQVPILKNIATIINAHHERRDGSGYPNKLVGNEIPTESTILAIADTFDAMTTSRIYKHRKSIPEALTEIEQLKETHFTTKSVMAAIKVLKDIKIDDTIHQNPMTTIEHERFSYFYKDSLTNLFNEHYLSAILSKQISHESLDELNLILLNKFNTYNKEHGWTKGNKLLVKIAKQIKTLTLSKYIFRVQGDDFVILNSSKNPFEKRVIKELENILEHTAIKVVHMSFNTEKNSIDSLEKLEELQEMALSNNKNSI